MGLQYFVEGPFVAFLCAVVARLSPDELVDELNFGGAKSFGVRPRSPVPLCLCILGPLSVGNSLYPV